MIKPRGFGPLLTILFVEHNLLLKFNLRTQRLFYAYDIFFDRFESVQETACAAPSHKFTSSESCEFAKAIAAVDYRIIVLLLSTAKHEVAV